MLVLTRKAKERIVIAPGTPEETVIVIVNWNDRQVRLGIEAPRHITIMRSELLEDGNAQGDRSTS